MADGQPPPGPETRRPRESLQCVTSKLGGPAGLAAALQPKDGEPPTAYTKAATTCGQMAGGLQMAGPPGPRTPDPFGMNDTGLLVSDLSDAELSCLSENGDPQQLLMLVNRPDLASPQERDALAGCLEHETLLKLFLNGFTDQAGPMSNDTSALVVKRRVPKPGPARHDAHRPGRTRRGSRGPSK